MKSFKKDLANHIPDLSNYSQVLCGNEEDGNDLLSATIAQALEQQRQWSGQTPLNVWLFRMMYRQFLTASGKGSLSRERREGTFRDFFIAPYFSKALGSAGKRHTHIH